ncbi:MAG: hypothetical protein ACD_18C00193G0003 [uncultured bacterium]|nr:MAG: hypothetical protein ACD_18C00193G0003 [uncultured bacterium]
MGRDRIDNVAKAYEEQDRKKQQKQKDKDRTENNTPEDRYLSPDSIKIGEKVRIFGDGFDNLDIYQITQKSSEEITIQKWKPSIIEGQHPGNLETEKITISVSDIKQGTIKLLLQFN